MKVGKLFLRSRKAEVNVQRILDKMYIEALEHDIEAEDAIVDRGNSRDIDRDHIGELLDEILSSDVEALVLLTVGDITDDIHDLVQFMKDAEECGVTVYSMDGEFRQWNNIQEDKSEED